MMLEFKAVSKLHIERKRVKVQSMLQKDIPAVRTFGAQNAMMQGFNDGLFFSEEQLDRMHSSDDSLIVVVKEQARVVGLLVAMVNRSSGTAIVTHFYVETPYRSRGVRERLLDHFRSLATRMCVVSASLTVKLMDLDRDRKFLARQCGLSSSPVRLHQLDLRMEPRE